MYRTIGYAASAATHPLAPFQFERRSLLPHDVRIRIRYCGICRSDIHQARNEWGDSTFPMVPGHEIVGTVSEVGPSVNRFQPGDMVGVGCFVDSCRRCTACRQGLEQYCDEHLVLTYNGTEADRRTPTFGGYSTQIVVDVHYVLRIPPALSPERAAPLLCAGITTYSPLRHWHVGRGDHLAVVGFGGLGHMAVKFGKALGCHVTVLSHSKSKAEDAKRLGADAFVETSGTTPDLRRRFEWILDTVSAPHPYSPYLEMLKTDGTMILVGAPDRPSPLGAFPLILGRRRLVGSLIGGIRETQEMLQFCAEHGIASDVEIIPIQDTNAAYERVIRGDVRYRFVIDLSSLREDD
jgi:uncharacterized zinc-type alcohol dehydrogenase-like protein